MKKHLHNPRYWSLLAGVVFCLLYHGLPDFPQWGQYAFFVFFVVILGIPHGALDHLVEEKYARQRNGVFSMPGFLVRYLVQMLAYAVLWYFFPAISLAVFLAFSAWHFGESDFSPAPGHWLWRAGQWLLGCLVLVFILLREPTLTGDLIGRIAHGNQAAQGSWAWAARSQGWVLGWLAVTFAVAVCAAQLRAPRKPDIEKAIAFMAFMAVLYFMPLLPAFALYFGGWHSVNTFRHIGEFLSGTEKRGSARLWLAALPLTGAALAFLLLFAWLWQHTLAGTDPLPVLFVFIAIITLPHLRVMHRMLAPDREVGS